ncbi:MAG: hypothetical protein PUC55_05300 [Lachnospiraceae bacterium]|nr:hypothetical protein [Lachnospiraceae bacterium]
MKQFTGMICLLVLLLFFHTQAIAGTRNGLLLWYQTLIPSLLPFILVTNALAETNAYQAAARFLSRYTSRNIYPILAVTLGNLCGYPIGGKILNDFVHNQYISVKDANYLLCLTSQASPMFLIGYVHLHILQNKLPLSVFLLSIYLPTILYAFVLSIIKHPIDLKTSFLYNRTHRLCITDTFLHTVNILVTIGMYVILFSIIIQILQPLCQIVPAKLLLSSLEITTGLQLLQSIAVPESIRLALICCLSSWGGLCSAFQIKGVLNYPNASIKKYLLDKCILSAGTFLIVYSYICLICQ